MAKMEGMKGLSGRTTFCLNGPHDQLVRRAQSKLLHEAHAMGFHRLHTDAE
jgi:hypothetical protein